MADERLRYIFDVVGNKKVEQAFNGVGAAATKSGAQTETGTAKMTGSLGAFAAKAAPFAAAGAAIASVAMKSVNAFRDLALEAGRFSDASGLSVESASRWIEVAGDVGVETEAIQSAVTRMNRALASSPDALRSLGIEAVRTADGVVDVNATFLAAIDVLNRMQDPMKRAQAAQQLFGRNWQQMAELIGRGSRQLAEDLAAVGDGKVIDDKELEKARRYREAMDKLSDAVGELALVFGEELAPAISTVADALSKVSAVAGPAMGQLSKSFKALGGEGSSAWHRAGAAILTMGGSEVLRGLRNVADAFNPSVSGSLAAGLTLLPELADEALDSVTQFGTAIDNSAPFLARGNHAASEYAVTVDRLGSTIRPGSQNYQAVADWTNLLLGIPRSIYTTIDASKPGAVLESGRRLRAAEQQNVGLGVGLSGVGMNAEAVQRQWRKVADEVRAARKEVEELNAEIEKVPTLKNVRIAVDIAGGRQISEALNKYQRIGGNGGPR